MQNSKPKLNPSLARLHDVKQAAQMLSMSTTRLYELINEGVLKAKKLGRRTYVTDEAISDFIGALEDYPLNTMEA